MKRVLNAGCGSTPLPACFGDVQEIRLDIDPSVNPDIVSPITDLGDIGQFDGVFSSHVLEHLFPHELDLALSEFYRVLKHGGLAVCLVPDLEDVKATDEVLFESFSGPVAGLDLIYGMRSVLNESPYMAHHNGFTSETLQGAFERNGFESAYTKRLPCFNLFCAGVKIESRPVHANG